MNLDEMQAALADFLSERGVEAIASWPEERRTHRNRPVTLISLEEVDCGPAAMQDYLGQMLDEESGMWKDVYGRRATMTFVLDVLAPACVGARKCRSVFADIFRIFQMEKPTHLSVRELTGGEPEYDEKEGLLRLRCRLECSGWLYAAGEEAAGFLEFALRGDVNL